MPTETPATDQPIRDRFLVFGAPDIQEPDIQEVVDTLRSGWLGMGPRCQRFEEAFRAYIGCRHALALNSCTAGLALALEAARIGPGDEVITTPLTFCATANVIVQRGALPEFVDVERDTGNIDPGQVERAITPRTRAIMPVHLYGRPCAMDELLGLARQHNLVVIEDAAHAAEAWYRGRKVGALGDLTAFSFYVTKNLVTGEGGMLTTNSDALADDIRVLRLHGLSKDAWKRYSAAGFQPYDVLAPGYKFNMMDIQAALGLHQLARLEANLKVREDFWSLYDHAFSAVDEVACPAPMPVEPDQPPSRHARHLYTLLLDLDRLPGTRWDFVEAMRADNIGTGIHFLALHLSQFYQHALGHGRGDFPNAEHIADRTVSLPLSTAMREHDVEDVIRAVKRNVRRPVFTGAGGRA